MQTALCGKVLVSRNVRNRKTRSILAGLLSLGILFLLSGGLASLPVSAASSLQYHNVQVFLQTQSQDGNMYTLTTYQSNGTLISSTQSQYPAFSLELPTGTYLFAASVVNKSSSYWWSYSTSEYGYQRQQISSDTTINIQTQALQNIPTSKITIETNFVNGTGMSGASVYASVIGMWYWSSMYNDRALILSNQTSNGVVTLTVPDLPVEVTAWNWIQVNLPSNETTVQKSIGGQVINVTVYWQPMYVGLSGSAVIIPPENSAQITMYANQEQNYWMYAPGTMYASPAMATNGYPGMATMSSASSALPAQVAGAQQQFSSGGPTQYTNAPPQYLPPNQIPSVVPVDSNSTPMTNELLIAAVIIAVGLACASLVAMMLGRGKHHGQPTLP